MMSQEKPPTQAPPNAFSLMTPEEYERGEAEHPYEWPYVLKLEKDGNVLDYFGEAHSFDPDDKQWEAVKTLWSEFLNKTSGRKRVAFVEGGIRKSHSSEQESIEEDGGMGLVTWLAQKENILTFSPEPNEKLEREELEKQFSRDEIQYYYFARVVHQYGRKQEPRPDFEIYMKSFLKADKRASGWDDFDFSLENMKAIHKRLFETEFDPNAESFWANVADPVYGSETTNRVARASSTYRDIHIANEIVRRLENDESVFAQIGGSHVIMQEPLLRGLLKVR